MLKMLVPCTVSLIVGAGIGWMLQGANGVTPQVVADPIAARAMSAPRGSSYVPTGIDVAQLRIVLREELAAARVNDAQGTLPTAIKEPAPSHELVAERRAAVEEIETMIRGGEWGNEQRVGFQERLALLDPEQGARLLREVTIALNNGTLHVTTGGPPL